jgi:glutathione synthase/RimK-type ligase-like ATP-grasp enzyme
VSLIFLYHSKNCRSIVQNIATEIGVGARIVKDTEFVPPGTDHVVIRWNSKRVTKGLREVNTRDSVVLVDNKATTRTVLRHLAPRTVVRERSLFFPCIIRPYHHFGGKSFHLCRTPLDAKRAIARCGKHWYASEVVDKLSEYRVFVLQGRVVSVTQKFAPADGGLAWNWGAGGTADHVVPKEWPIPVCVAALRGATQLGLDWVAMDVGYTKNGAVIFEGNTAPGVKKHYTVNRIVRAFRWLVENPPLPPLVIPQEPTWKNLIHPALLKP